MNDHTEGTTMDELPEDGIYLVDAEADALLDLADRLARTGDDEGAAEATRIADALERARVALNDERGESVLLLLGDR